MIGDLMKQAQQMQEKMAEMKKDMETKTVTGESGAGMVKVVMNGRHDVSRVEVEPSVLAEDKAMLEDLVAAAVNDAVRKVEEANQEMMKQMTGGLTLPPGFKMPF